MNDDSLFILKTIETESENEMKKKIKIVEIVHIWVAKGFFFVVNVWNSIFSDSFYGPIARWCPFNQTAIWIPSEVNNMASISPTIKIA